MRIQFLALLPFVAAALTASPLSGDWTADPRRPDARRTWLHPMRMRLDFQGQQLALEESGTLADGRPYGFAIAAGCGGKVNGILDNPEIDGVQCWSGDGDTVAIKLLRAGAVIEWRKIEVRNGQLRITSTVAGHGGRDEQSVAVLLRR